MKKIMGFICLSSGIFLAACGSGTTESSTSQGASSFASSSAAQESSSETAASSTTASTVNTAQTAVTNSSEKASVPSDTAASDMTALAELEQAYPNQVMPHAVAVERQLNIASDSQKNKFSVLYYEKEASWPLNDTRLNEEQPFAHFTETTYDSAEKAQDAVAKGTDLGGQKVDLGHNITGYQQGAAGSSYLTWQEGNWTIVVRASNVEGEEPVTLAKEVVNYLEKAFLPAPRTAGQINLQVATGDYRQNTVTWQKDTKVYQVSATDAMKALDIAVAVN